MAETPILRTPRLILRGWRASDREPFAAMNADPRVMQHFPSTLSRAESDGMADRVEAGFAAQGFDLWAVEVPGEIEFAGFVGLSVARFTAPFTPCVEIGWRLGPAVWGRGYATEGAAACLDFAFDAAGLDEVVSFTAPVNRPSWRVMQRLGMHRSPAEDFEHPSLPPGHRLRLHVLYRISAAEWRAWNATRPCD